MWEPDRESMPGTEYRSVVGVELVVSKADVTIGTTDHSSSSSSSREIGMLYGKLVISQSTLM